MSRLDRLKLRTTGRRCNSGYECHGPKLSVVRQRIFFDIHVLSRRLKMLERGRFSPDEGYRSSDNTKFPKPFDFHVLTLPKITAALNDKSRPKTGA